jgi:hypothetical protein
MRVLGTLVVVGVILMDLSNEAIGGTPSRNKSEIERLIHEVGVGKETIDPQRFAVADLRSLYCRENDRIGCMSKSEKSNEVWIGSEQKIHWLNACGFVQGYIRQHWQNAPFQAKRVSLALLRPELFNPTSARQKPGISSPKT